MEILLVEDEKINAMMATRMLEKRGHTVTHAANGRKALDLFEKQHYALILMDVQMPEMDGLEATKRIRLLESKEGRPRTPIIAMTAFAEAEDQQRCLDAGMDRYLTKPIDLGLLDRVIQSFLGGEL